jgi:hypothetical protein
MMIAAISGIIKIVASSVNIQPTMQLPLPLAGEGWDEGVRNGKTGENHHQGNF